MQRGTHWAVLTVALLLLLAVEQRRSFVLSAPASPQQHGLSEGEDIPKDFDEVKQLEELKNSLGKTFSLLKTHSSSYSELNGQREGHSESREEVSRDGQLLARLDQRVDSAGEPGVTPATRVLTELDFPARGVHKTLVQGSLERPPEHQPQQQQQHEPMPSPPPPPASAPVPDVQPQPMSQPPADITENGDRRSAPDSPNNVAKYLPYSGIQYSPLDMAEYVFWSGDERGVTLAIEEFLQEGLMTREEAINFLQEIKFNLDFLQNHYTQQRLHKQEQIQAKERAALMQKALGLDKPRPLPEEKLSSELSHEGLLEKKSVSEFQPLNRDVSTMNSNRLQQQNLGLSDEDYEELLERLRVADFLYTEYSLEEVIYQLAKVMFSQSLTRGNADAQEALQKFTSFLESEAEQGHISRSLEKKVLDVLIASLADTLSEHPQLAIAAREGLDAPSGGGGNKLLHQLLLLNPAAAGGEGTGAAERVGAIAAGGASSGFVASEAHQSALAKARQLAAEAAAAAEEASANKANKAA